MVTVVIKRGNLRVERIISGINTSIFPWKHLLFQICLKTLRGISCFLRVPVDSLGERQCDFGVKSSLYILHILLFILNIKVTHFGLTYYKRT